MKKLFLIFSVLAALSITEGTSIKKTPIPEANRSFTNFYPNNNSECHVGIQSSFLYWMIGTHCTYAYVYKTTRATAYANSPTVLRLQYMDEDLSEIIKGKEKTNIGFSIRASFFKKSLDGWELGAKIQVIDYNDNVLNGCERIFTDNEWHPQDSNSNNFPIPFKNNGYLARVTLLTPESFIKTRGHTTQGPVTYLLDCINETLEYKSLILDLTNFGFLYEGKFMNFGLSMGLEFDWIKNKIYVGGANTFIAAPDEVGDDPEPQIYIEPFLAKFFAYQLTSKTFCLGPFFSLHGALRFEENQNVFQLNTSLYGAGLYSKNKYLQDTTYSDMFSKTLSDWEKNHTTVGPKSLYPQSSCALAFTKPQLRYDTHISLYHSKVVLGIDYSYNAKNIQPYLGIDWEINNFLNFFNRDIPVYSHDDLNYQGLTATLGFSF